MYCEVIPLKQFRAGATPDSGVLTYALPENFTISAKNPATPTSVTETAPTPKTIPHNPIPTTSTLSPGHLITVPLGRTTTPGIITRITQEKPPFPTKPITSVIDPTPLPPHLLKSLFWLSDYYFNPLPAVANLILPSGLTKSRRIRPLPPTTPPKIPLIPLNPAQKQALTALQQAPGATKLLHGVTGSGKTNIYLTLALNALKQQKSTILLVPEIALTSQLVQIFEQTFGTQVTLIHSRQTESTRHQIWLHLLHSTGVGADNTAGSQPSAAAKTSSLPPLPQIVIGPRSALFAPLHNLGLIIIDEAHESTFYQDTSPRYSALRLASFIAKSTGSQAILGTATPLIQDYYLAQSQNSLIPLTQKAKTTAHPPKIQIIDLKDQSKFPKNRYFSSPLLAQIRQNLKNHHQTLIFHNRRGSAPLTLCTSCGWQALCPTCFLPLTLHTDAYQLVCHTCGYTTQVPPSCPSCGQLEVIHKGFGTKLLENELKKLFPEAKIARFDADNAKNETLDATYTSVKNGEIDLLIGTQAITKGLDLPHLATVGVVQADAGLSLPDFSAEERTFHLLTQVIGRVGRGHLDEASCIIQTYQPSHPTVQFATTADYPAFYQYMLKKRRAQHFPPFTYLAKLSLTYKTEATTLKNIQKLHQSLKNSLQTQNFPKNSNSSKSTISAGSPESAKSSAPISVSVSMPTPAFHEHNHQGFTWQILLKSPSRTHLTTLLRTLPPNKNLRITLDPPSLL